MPRVRRGRFALTVLACSAALASGCGDSSETADQGSSALGSPELQTTAREADCMDWNEASTEEQQAIIASIAEFEGGAPTGTSGQVLPEDEAYELFERACAQDYAGAFKLYKLYARAAAFQPAQP